MLFIFTWGNDPIWRAYFSTGLKPPGSIGGAMTVAEDDVSSPRMGSYLGPEILKVTRYK